MSRICPDDGAALEPRPLHGLTLDACPLCAGLYFDEGEICALSAGGPAALGEAERAAVPADLEIVANAAFRRCPGCRKTMSAYAFRYSSDIRLDGCSHCGGVWVQDGELARIAAHLRCEPASHGGIPAARRAAESQNAAVRHAATLRVLADRLP